MSKLDMKCPIKNEACEYCNGIQANGGFKFLGCYHEPYHGKWVEEIEKCPKEKADENC